MSNQLAGRLFWAAAVAVVVGSTFWLWYSSRSHRNVAAARAPGLSSQQPASSDDDAEGEAPAGPIGVKTIKPRRGAMERITVQVGSIEADEVHLYAMVSGILKSQSVLIGDRVKKGKELAVIDVPDLEKHVDRNAAVVEQAEARVQQMKAKVAIAEADLDAANAQTSYAEANARASSAWLVFRGMQYQRMKDLFKTNSVEERLVDEAKERHEAARESENAAKAGIVTSRAQARSAQAKILLNKADVGEAEAQVKIAKADLAKSQVQLSFARITAPFDGVITQRSLIDGAAVRAVGERGTPTPIMTVQRTDMVRVVVQVPDDAARYANRGDAAFVELDAFPGLKFKAEVSRIAEAEDPQTRLMRVEIDLPNPRREIRQGMYGRASIVLEGVSEQLSIPTTCLAGKFEAGRGAVFVERDGKVRRARVKLGMINDKRVEVLQGLTEEDHIVVGPPTALRDDLEVSATLMADPEPKADVTP